MILDDDFWGYEDCDVLDLCSCLTGISLLEFTNMAIDTLRMKNVAEGIANCSVPDWTNNTLLAANFQGNTEAGSIGANGFDVTSVAIKKRRKGDLKWNTIAETPYSSSIDNYLTYEAEDRYVDAYETYEYAITPIAGDVEGNYNTSEILVNFDWAYLFDSDYYYALKYDFSFGTITSTGQSAEIVTLGGKYPVVVYNGELDYQKASLQCKLLFDDDGEMNTVKTRNYRNAVLKFLKNKKPKVIKGADGLYMLVNITGDISLTSNARIKNMYDVSFSFSEIGDVHDYTTCEEYGLTGVDVIVSS